MSNLSRRDAVLGAAALAGCTSNRIAGNAPYAEPEHLADIADAVVRPALAEEGIPGASFVAFDTQGRIATRTWGFADREANRAVTDETVWPIASITKTLTATAAMTLVDRRRVALDADITTYLRDTRIPPFAGPPITLRRLLTHTSGFDEVRGRMCSLTDAPERLADFLNRKLVRIRPAGQLTAYSSYAPTVAQQLIEDIAGGRYEDYVREAIFEPLDMRSARFVLRAPDLAGLAAPYDVDDGQATRRSEYEFYITTGASSACATTPDMARFGIALLRPGAGRARVLSGRAVRDMLRQQATAHPAVPGWGLGFQLDQVGGRWIAEHGGDIGGFAGLFTLIPEAGIGFYTAHHGEGGSLRHRVRSAVLASVAPESPQAPTPNARAAADLREYSGRYRSTLEELSQPADPDTLFEVSTGAGTLQLWDQTWIPVGGDLFVRDDGLRKLGFARDAEGRVMALTNGSWRVLLKV